MTADALSPYVPRLLQEWGDEGDGPSWKALDSTLVFIDLSGFTAMSERLARQGRVGAEEVVDVIGSTFAELLALAYAMGGSLLKFGGDALLLIYTGERHAERGARAAWDMRGALRRMGAIPTSAGGVRLRMTAGVHSGTIPLFLAGRSHRELFVVGPDASTVVAMESAASAGQILVSEATAERLSPAVVGDALGPGRLLRGQPRVAAAPAPPPSPGLPSAAFVPRAVREHVLGGGAEPEHRQVTVAFAHFDGTDAMIQSDGEDKVARLLDDFMMAVEVAANDHDLTIIGSDIDADGGKVVLAAGAPVAHEDDDERMIRALRSILSSGVNLPIRIGTRRGPVFAADIGPPYRRSYTVMGDVVNTAARIMAHAEAGQLLATAEVLDGCDTHFSSVELPPFRAKGKAAPIVTFEVGEPIELSADEMADDARLPLCARRTELETILNFVDGATRGTGSIAEIVGDAGMGKSRLVDEIVVRRPDVPWHRVVCQRYDQEQAWFAVRPIARHCLGLDDDSSPAVLIAALEAIGPGLGEASSLVGPVVGIPVPEPPAVLALDQRDRRDLLHHSLAEVLRTRLPAGTGWIIDDAQWMDDASAAFITYLRSRAPSSAQVVLLARRPGPPPVAGLDSTSVELQPLDREAALELVRMAAPGQIVLHDATVLVERADGHPLFLLELVRAFLAQADADVVPASVEASVAARIDQLGPRDRRFLRELSVLGSSFAIRDVAALGHDVRAARRQLARVSSFVAVGRDEVRFRQSMFRDVAYEALPHRRRQAIHGGILDYLESLEAEPSDRRQASLSLHASAAGRLEAAWRYGRAAATQARASHSYVAAAVFARRALDAGRKLKVDPTDAAQTWRDLGQSLWLTANFEEARAALRQGRRLATDLELVTQLHFLEGLVRADQGRHDAAVRWFLRGLRLPPGPGDPEVVKLRNRIKVGLAEVRLQQGALDEAGVLFDEALAEAELTGDEVGQAHALNGQLALGAATNNLAAESSGLQALAIFERYRSTRPMASVLCGLGNLLSNIGRWDEARGHYDRAYELLEEAGEAHGAATIAFNLGDLLAKQGHLDLARHRFDEALDAFAAAGHGYAHLARVELARLAARAGQFAEASVLFEEGATGLRNFGIPTINAQVELTRADIHVMAGRPKAAMAAIDHAAPDASLEYRPTIPRLRGLAMMQLGDTERGGTWLDEALALSRETHNAYEEALALDALVRLAASTGASATAMAAQRDELFARLGLRAVPVVPLVGV